MATLRVVAKRFRDHGATVGKNAKLLPKKVALKAHDMLVYTTPVDTSKALSNWRVSVGIPFRSVIPPYFKGTGGSTHAASARAAIKQGKDALAGYEHGNIFVSNTLNYIGNLNAGSSEQAPPGFIQTAIKTAVRVVAGANLLRKGDIKE